MSEQQITSIFPWGAQLDSQIREVGEIFTMSSPDSRTRKSRQALGGGGGAHSVSHPPPPIGNALRMRTAVTKCAPRPKRLSTSALVKTRKVLSRGFHSDLSFFSSK